MSSLYAQLSNGPFTLKYVQTMGDRPYTLTAHLSSLLDMQFEDRPANFLELVKTAVREFSDARLHLRIIVIDNAWKHKRWDRTSKNFYNMQCDLCTLDEAVADYLRSLPKAFVGSIAPPSLSKGEVEQASVACENLLRRAAAATCGFADASA